MPARLADLTRLELGGGRVIEEDGFVLRLPTTSEGYADAQLDDHRHLPRSEFPWKPPVELTLQARASLDHPQGTLGFGFWNDPFSLSLGQAGAARKLPASPNALWFFYGSEPNDMALAPGAPAAGWKASSLRTIRLPPVLLAGPALLAYGLSQLPLLRRLVVKAGHRLITASETGLEASLTEWHDYRIEWHPDQARFFVDDQLVLTAPHPPDGPLGFVTWIDNQYAILSPSKGIRFGVLPVPQAQELALRRLQIAPME